MHRLALPMILALLALLAAIPWGTLVVFSNPALAGGARAGKDGVDIGWFQNCTQTRVGYFDPIMYHGTPPPAGHRHLFLGSKAIRYDSSRSDLMSGGSSCVFKDNTTQGNHSGYWVEDLRLRNGSFAGSKKTTAYYTAWPGINPAKVTAPVKGVKIIARDVKKAQVHWGCAGLRRGGIQQFSARPHDCDPTSRRPYVSASIVFPSCSDGRKNSGDHMSHVAYPKAGGACPASHPKPFTRLRMGVRYDTSRGKGAKMADGGDPGTEFHADYFNAWSKTKFHTLLDKCLHASLKCWNDPAKKVAL